MTSDNEPISFAQASRLAPGRPHLQTVWRWFRTGVRGVKLQGRIVGARGFTTVAELNEFVRATTAAAMPRENDQQPEEYTTAVKEQLQAAGLL